MTEWLRLRHVADTVTSNVDKRKSDNEIPVRLINYTDVYYGDRLTPDLPLMWATASASEIARYRVAAGDILITKDSETADDIGIAAYVESSADDLVCGYHLSRIRAHKATVEPRYLFWALTGSHARDQFNVAATGVTRFGLRADSIRDLSIRVPPLPEQRVIANYLDTKTSHIDTLITKKHRMIELLKERERSLIDLWSDQLAAKHGLVSMRRWLSKIEQGWSPVCDSEPAEGVEWGVIKTSAVSSGTFLAENNKRLPDETEPDLRWMLHDGDLLVTRGSGSRRKVGRASVARVKERNLTLSDLVYRVVLTRAHPDYVAMTMSASSVREQLEGSIRTDAGQTLKIRRDDLADVRIPAVVREQQPFEVAGLSINMSSLRNSQRVIETQLGLLAERRQALITAAVTGVLAIS